MSKNKIISIFIGCAVLFSALACYLIYSYMSPSRGTVYVFNDNYEAGEQINADMLSPLQVDSSIIMAGRTADVSAQFVTPEIYSDIVRSGDSLRIDVGKGMPLTTSMLSVSGGSSVEMNMTSNAVAVTVEVDSYTGVTNDLKEGSRVNVYAMLDSRVTLIQQNKRVLEVYRNGASIIGVSLEENIYESMELIYAANNGSIYLGLVDATGYQAAEGLEDPSYSIYDDPSEAYAYDYSTQTEAETAAETAAPTAEEQNISAPAAETPIAQVPVTDTATAPATEAPAMPVTEAPAAQVQSETAAAAAQ